MAGRARPSVLQGRGPEQDDQTEEDAEDRTAVRQVQPAQLVASQQAQGVTGRVGMGVEEGGVRRRMSRLLLFRLNKRKGQRVWGRRRGEGGVAGEERRVVGCV